MPFINTSEATKKSSDPTENGKSTYVTNRRISKSCRLVNPISHQSPRSTLTALSCSVICIIFLLFQRIFREFKASSLHFFALSILQICVWKQTFSPGKDERYRLTLDWRFGTLSQSEIRVHWWTHNSKNPTNLGRREFNWTLHQSSHGFATLVHGFASKTKALTREIPPATQAKFRLVLGSTPSILKNWRSCHFRTM